MKLQRLKLLLQEPRGFHQKTKDFFRKFLKSTAPDLQFSPDPTGNWHLRIPLADGSTSRTLFVAHYDTVDSVDTARKELVHIGDTLSLKQEPPTLPPDTLGYKYLKFDRRCLGADDGAGIEVLLSMAEAGVPGYYLLTWGEEAGAPGAYAAVETLDPDDFDRVISFDRRGTRSIITHQWMGQTCSETFALELARQLHMGHVPDPTGSFTDSAIFSNYSFPECTNISVGYNSEHSSRETLDLKYLSRLIQRCCCVSWETLPVEPIVTWVRPSDELVDLIQEYPRTTMYLLEDYGLAEEFLRELKNEHKLSNVRRRDRLSTGMW